MAKLSTLSPKERKEVVKMLVEYLTKYGDDLSSASYQPLLTLTDPPMAAIMTLHFDHGKRVIANIEKGKKK